MCVSPLVRPLISPLISPPLVCLFLFVSSLLRLRVLDSTMTLFKARQVLLENPSKRLLLRYIEATRNEETLSQDLSKHFNFKNSEKATRIARLLRSWVTTDFERGILIRELSYE